MTAPNRDAAAKRICGPIAGTNRICAWPAGHNIGNADVPDNHQPAQADHPYTDPGDGRTECDRCGKFVWPAIHSCKGVPVTEAAMRRWRIRQGLEPCCDLHNTNCEPPSELCCHHCTEWSHETFPTRHGDGSRCVLDTTKETR